MSVFTEGVRELLKQHNITQAKLTAVTNTIAGDFGLPKITRESVKNYLRLKDPRTPNANTLFLLTEALSQLTGKDISLRLLYDADAAKLEHITTYLHSIYNFSFIALEGKEYRDLFQYLEELKGIKSIEAATLKARIYIILAETQYRYGFYANATELYDYAITITSDNLIHLQHVEALVGKSKVIRKTLSNCESLDTYNLALSTLRNNYKETTWDEAHKVTEVKIIRLKGDTLRRMGFIQAKTYYLLGLKILERAFAKRVVNIRGHLYNGLGLLEQMHGSSLNEAEEYHLTALKHFTHTDNERGQAHSRVYLAKALYHKSLTLQKSERMGLKAQGREHLHKAEAISESLHDKGNIAYVYYVKALIERVSFPKEGEHKSEYTKQLTEHINKVKHYLEKAHEYFGHGSLDENRRGCFYVYLIQAYLYIKQTRFERKYNAQNTATAFSALQKTEACLKSAHNYLSSPKIKSDNNSKKIVDFQGAAYLYVAYSDYFLEQCRQAPLEDKEDHIKSILKYAHKTLALNEKPISFNLGLDTTLKNTVDFEEEYCYVPQGHVKGNAHLNCGLAYLELARSNYQLNQSHKIKNTEVIKSSLKEALKHFTLAIVIFEEKTHYRNVGICHSYRAELMREQYNFYNTQTLQKREKLVLLISLLRKELHYYQLAMALFQKIDHETQIKIIAQKLRTNEDELNFLKEQLMNCSAT